MRVIYLLVKQGKKTYWNRAGAAFENRDGSVNVKLDIFPELTFQIRPDDKVEDSDERRNIDSSPRD